MKLRSSASTNTNDNAASFYYQTRNSAIADKPRHAFVQMQRRGWLKNTPSAYVLPPVVKVRGFGGGAQPPAPIWAPLQ